MNGSPGPLAGNESEVRNLTERVHILEGRLARITRLLVGKGLAEEAELPWVAEKDVSLRR